MIPTISVKSKMIKFAIGSSLRMKKKPLVLTLVAIVALALACAAVFLFERSKVALIIDDEAAWDLRDSSPQKKVIISEGGMVARYLSEDGDNYIGEIQDTVRMPKSRAMVDTWYACDGKGVVYLKDFGAQPSYAAPDSLSAVVGELRYESGYCPDTYSCKGYKDGWFVIETGGNTGYVREEYVYWDAIDSF